jgi:hypothetical protein
VKTILEQHSYSETLYEYGSRSQEKKKKKKKKKKNLSFAPPPTPPVYTVSSRWHLRY